ncbi:MAG: hypothetical protein FK730_08850 [Asgard group archaeon]|nr:hypothetical protein [Asgard group archaeon]
MNDLISLTVWCPICSKSLMNKEKLVDGKPSVELEISDNGNKGTIWLSSYYGSYNVDSDIEIVQDQEYKFSCPHCKNQITSDIKCEDCSSKMVPLNIEGVGIVKICSKSGCKHHTIEVEDLEYLDYFKVKKEMLESGTYLRTFCPHCHKSNAEGNIVKFIVTNEDGETGDLMLSPYLNLFTHKSTIDIPEGSVAKDIKCPNCERSLIEKDKKCEICGSQVVNLDVAAVTKLVDFYFCSKKGCHWHSLSADDMESVLLEDSTGW